MSWWLCILGQTSVVFLILFQGKYTDAEPLYLRSIAIMDQTPVPDQNVLGVTLNNLASLFHTQVGGQGVLLELSVGNSITICVILNVMTLMTVANVHPQARGLGQPIQARWKRYSRFGRSPFREIASASYIMLPFVWLPIRSHERCLYVLCVLCLNTPTLVFFCPRARTLRQSLFAGAPSP